MVPEKKMTGVGTIIVNYTTPYGEYDWTYPPPTDWSSWNTYMQNEQITKLLREILEELKRIGRNETTPIGQDGELSSTVGSTC